MDFMQMLARKQLDTFPRREINHFHIMKKAAGRKINFPQKEIFVKIKCIQTLWWHWSPSAAASCVRFPTDRWHLVKYSLFTWEAKKEHTYLGLGIPWGTLLLPCFRFCGCGWSTTTEILPNCLSCSGCKPPYLFSFSLCSAKSVPFPCLP